MRARARERDQAKAARLVAALRRKLLSEVRSARAAVVIQTSARGMLGRARARKERRREAAAVQVQRYTRGYLERNWVVEMRTERDAEVVIAKTFRRWAAQESADRMAAVAAGAAAAGPPPSRRTSSRLGSPRRRR